MQTPFLAAVNNFDFYDLQNDGLTIRRNLLNLKCETVKMEYPMVNLRIVNLFSVFVPCFLQFVNDHRGDKLFL